MNRKSGKIVEKALRKGDANFPQLLENINEGIIIQDKNLIITYANNKFLQLIGYKQDEVIGHPIGETSALGWLKGYGTGKAGAERDAWKPFEIAWKRKDGRKVFAILSPKPMYDRQGLFIGSVTVLTDITDRREVEIELRRSHEELLRLSHHLDRVREEESKRIAGEIHDELGQQLTILKMDLAWLTGRVQSGEKDNAKILEKIEAMSGLIDQTIQAVQKISAELRPGLLDDLGLLPAIEWLAQDFQSRTEIKCRTHFGRDDIELEPDLATAVFRISQEALTNVVRHAKATRVNIGIKEKNGALVLRIKDNGTGIKKERIWDPTSLGIMGMRERARRFGGELSIAGTRPRGTVLTAVFPPIEK